MKINIKRVYEKPDKEDGVRILVDRFWPRGLTKEKANIDLWLKDIAPSTVLRECGPEPLMLMQHWQLMKWNQDSLKKPYTRTEF